MVTRKGLLSCWKCDRSSPTGEGEVLHPQGPQGDKKAIKGCKVCARFAAQGAAEICPPLPKFRIETVAPWTVTSVDAAGPFAVKKRRGESDPSVYFAVLLSPNPRSKTRVGSKSVNGTFLTCSEEILQSKFNSHRVF